MKENIRAGIVIPVVQTKFLEGCLDHLYLPAWAQVLIINDGIPNIQQALELLAQKHQIQLGLNEQKEGFAGAVNKGFKILLETFPDIEFLGTLNDDTIPFEHWLEYLVETLISNNSGLAAPVQIIPGKGTVDFYKAGDFQYQSFYKGIKKDTEVEVIPGSCFIASKKALEVVGWLDDVFKNSCEDYDFSLRFRKENFKIFISHKSKIIHFGGKSRWGKDTVTDLKKSHQYLKRKWDK